MKPIPTRVHGALDYLSAAVLFALPRALGWSAPVTRLTTGAAAATVAYSACTRYEWGIFPILPMPVHLAIDGAQAALFTLSPLAFPEEDGAVRRALAGIGLFEMTVTMLSQSETPASRAG